MLIYSFSWKGQAMYVIAGSREDAKVHLARKYPGIAADCEYIQTLFVADGVVLG